MAKDILFPIGRMIGGSVKLTPATDSKTNLPKLIKSGPNMGQPLHECSFGVAIPKEAGHTHWAHTVWGGAIYAEGQVSFPAGETQMPAFSWKIIDGDSTIPNKKMKKPCDQQGYPGNWIIWFSSGSAPQLCEIIGNKAGEAPRQLAPGMEILAGYYIQVFGNVKDNKPSETPGVYLNHKAVALAAYGERISTGPDIGAIGFGGAALPAGASLAPVGGMMAPPAGLPPLPGVPVGLPPLVIVPNPAILAAPPAPPPAAPARVMLGAYTYEQLQAANYSDAQMIAQGYMQA
jgi:hypothetical protein